MEKIPQGIIDEIETIHILVLCLNKLNRHHCLSRKLVRECAVLAQKLVASKDNNEYSKNLLAFNVYLDKIDTKEQKNESPT